MKKQTGLGKGISALIIDEITEEQQEQGVIEIDINKIEPNREQPRRNFDEEALKELAKSIKEYGIVQPLIVSRDDGYYSIVAGERRWRAARLLKLKTIPVIIKDYSDREKLQIALVENIQREDLNPMEQAVSYRKLIDEYFFTQEDIADKIGKSRSSVGNMLRLLNLDERVQSLVSVNKISEGVARLLLTVEDNELQYSLADQIADEEMSVREAGTFIKQALENKGQPVEVETVEKSIVTYKSLERDLKEIFGTKVLIKEKNKKGKIQIEYYSHEELERLLEIIGSLK